MGCVRPLAPEQLVTRFTDPNQIVRGAREIGHVARLFRRDEKGKVLVDQDGDPVIDEDRVYYQVRAGKLDVSRHGRELVSTVGRIRTSILGTHTPIEEAA
jgi:hypothetical protein